MLLTTLFSALAVLGTTVAAPARLARDYGSDYAPHDDHSHDYSGHEEYEPYHYPNHHEPQPYPDPKWPYHEPTYPDWKPDYDAAHPPWMSKYPTECDAYNLHDKFSWWGDKYHDLATPEGQYLRLSAVAKGYEKYQCKGGYWEHYGTYADLYDTSCPYNYMYKYGWNVDEYAASLPKGTYDYMPYPAGDYEPWVYMMHEYYETEHGWKPKWWRVSDGMYMYGDKTGSYSYDPAHVDWARYEAIDGYTDPYLSYTVLKTHTYGGMYETHECHTEGEWYESPYSANYWFFA